MQVVEHDQQGSIVRGLAQEGHHRVEQAKPGLLRLRQRGARQFGQAADLIAQFRHELRDFRSAGSEPIQERRGLDAAVKRRTT